MKPVRPGGRGTGRRILLSYRIAERHIQSIMGSTAGSEASQVRSAASFARIDSTYTSLYSLLAAPASSSAHLSLLPPPALYSSITLYLSRLPKAALPEFVQTLAGSQSLWNATVLIDGSVPGRIHEEVNKPLQDTRGQAPCSLAVRAYQIHLAAARAALSHIELLVHLSGGNPGWSTQRKLKSWVDLINKNLTSAEGNEFVPNPLMKGQVIPQLSILTGIIVGFNAYYQQGKSAADLPNRVDVRPALRSVRTHWARALEATFQNLLAMDDPPMPSPQDKRKDAQDQWEREFAQNNTAADAMLIDQGRRSALVQEAALVPLLLAAQAGALVSDRTLTELSAEPVLRVLPLCLLPLFEPPNLRLAAEPGAVKTPVTHALFPCLGPLSRILSAAAEQAALRMRGDDLERIMLGTSGSKAFRAPNAKIVSSLQPQRELRQPGLVRKVVEAAAQLETRFNGAQLGSLSVSSTDSGNKATMTDVWSTLKSFLFFTVQLFDAILDGFAATLPSPVYSTLNPDAFERERTQSLQNIDVPTITTTNIPLHVLETLHLQVLGLYNLTFVTFSITREETATPASSSEPSRQVTSNEIYNRFTTYRHAFYGSLEVIKADLGASTALLEALLARLEADGRALPEWQQLARITVLLDTCEQLVLILPDALIETRVLPHCRPHLRHDDSQRQHLAPFESAHSCVLAIFDAKRSISAELMPYYVDCLLLGFRKGQISSAQISHALVTVVACLSDVDDARSYWVVETVQEAAANADISATQRLELQLALVDMLPMLNLVLLRSLLAQVRKYILEAPSSLTEATETITSAIEKETAVESPKHRLCSQTFKALSQMDDTARQEGVRWWLDNRGEFGV